MFKVKEKARAAFAADSISIISAGMKIEGDIDSEHDMRIDGAIKGNVYCKAKIVLGTAGSVEGDLHALNADILGSVKGNIIIKDLLCLKSKCTVNGDLTTGQLTIEPDAEFNGTCNMANAKSHADKPKVLLLQD